MKQILLFGLLLLLNACGVPEESTPAPTPEAIHIKFPPALKPWADKIAVCASSNPLIALYFNQSPTQDNNIGINEVALELGETSQLDMASYLSQIGWEQIVVIVNQDNELFHLPTGMLQSIYSGQTSGWDNDPGQPIQVWVLPNGDPVRTYFDHAVLQSSSLTSEAMLAPDPEALLETISLDANAIGYLPESILSAHDPNLVSKVKIIQLDTPLKEELYLPVIALSHSEPEGLIRELLVCVQSAVP